MTFRELVESNDLQYTVVRLGGSIGEKTIWAVRHLKGEKYDGEFIYDTLEDAKSEAKERNKCLSPGDKKHYGIKYVTASLKNLIFTGKSK